MSERHIWIFDSLRVLFSWENLVSPTHDTISGDGLTKLFSRTETAAETKKVAAELVQLMTSHSSEPTQDLSLVLCSSDNDPSTYVLPRVRSTSHIMLFCFVINNSLMRLLLPNMASHQKEVGSRLSIEIAAGTILTSRSISSTVEVSETVIEAKHAAQKHRASWKASQEPIWKRLLQHAIDQNLVPPHSIEQTISSEVGYFKGYLQKAQSGIQIAVANRLLHHFGRTSRLVAYSPPEGEAAEDGETELNDDLQLE